MNGNIESAIKWLAESNIRNNDKDTISFGGINNGYDWQSKKYPYVYSEITGYAINSFLNIYKWLKEEKYLRYAKEAADYLLRIQSEDRNKTEYGAIPHSLTLPDLKVVRIYWTFDNAVLLHGIADLYSIIKEEKYYDTCLKIADWLLSMQNQDGSFLAFYDANTGVKDHELKEFHGDNGCLHVKNALGLLKLADISNDEKYYNAAQKVCDWGLKLQDSDGIFWANPKKKYVFTHAHCYATEGYLYAYYIFNNQKYLTVAQMSGDGLIKLQNQDGSLYRIYKNRFSIGSRIKERIHPWKTVDATAQAVRIWLILHSITNDEKYLKVAQKGISFLKSMQELGSKDDNMVGGFYYQCCDTFRARRLSNMMFAWCTEFSIAALCAFEHLEREGAYHEMIKELF